MTFKSIFEEEEKNASVLSEVPCCIPSSTPKMVSHSFSLSLSLSLSPSLSSSAIYDLFTDDSGLQQCKGPIIIFVSKQSCFFQGCQIRLALHCAYHGMNRAIQGLRCTVQLILPRKWTRHLIVGFVNLATLVSSEMLLLLQPLSSAGPHLLRPLGSRPKFRYFACDLHLLT